MGLFTEFIGRFHPLLLHLPIGILIFAYLQWCFDIWKAKSKLTNLTFALSVGCITSVLSALTGWALAKQGGYDQELLDWHQYLGIGTAVGSILLLIIYSLKPTKLVFGLVFTVFMVLLSATGHFGGSLTHGKGFLTKSATKEETKSVVDIQEAHIFNDLVMPIFKRKCVSCHNPEKSKGDLLFHNLEGWKKGGKNGKVLIAGVPSESNILQRAYLPKEDKEHMPPDGKLQLSMNELNFLEWWIEEMKNYDHKVKDLPPNTKVDIYLKSLEGKEFDGLEKVSPKLISNLYQVGIIVNPISANTPWVDVSFIQKDNIKSSLKKLNSIAKNVIEINLSNSDFTDQDTKLFKQFTNLKKLNLSGCNIGNDAIRGMSQLPKLANLNIYNTKVNNGSLQYLSEFQNLKKVYIWQTNIDEQSANKWELENTNIELNYGVDQLMFGTPKLAGPFIEGETELFQDSLLISLITNNPRAKINYTIANNKGITNHEYSGPFYIKESVEIFSFLHQNGWINSDTVKSSFVRAKYKPKSIILYPQANEKYPGNGPSTLIDFTKGSEAFGDGKWQGFYETNVYAIIDLGEVQTLESVSVGTLIDDRSYIFPPTEIRVEISNDNINFHHFASEKYQTQKGPTTVQIKNHILHGDISEARYIKLFIKGQKHNPIWHAAPGAACWLFVDEIVIE